MRALRHLLLSLLIGLSPIAAQWHGLGHLASRLTACAEATSTCAAGDSGVAADCLSCDTWAQLASAWIPTPPRLDLPAARYSTLPTRRVHAPAARPLHPYLAQAPPHGAHA